MRVLDYCRGDLEWPFLWCVPGLRKLAAECPVDNCASDIEKRSGAKGKSENPSR